MNADVPQMEEERSAACGLSTQRSYCVCTRSHLKRPYYAFLGWGYAIFASDISATGPPQGELLFPTENNAPEVAEATHQ